MDKPELASDTMAVVVLGEFDPLLLTPRWLRQADLIAAEDYDSYDTEVISPNVTSVKFGSIHLKVLTTTLEVTTEAAADLEVARDLAAGILLSKGAPRVSAMGINRMVHFPAELEGYHAVGDTLTPKDVWDGVLHLPGMLNLSIVGARDDGYGGNVNVQVQPSALIRPGVFVSVNDHYTLTRVAPITDRNALLDPETTDSRQSAEKVPVAAKILTEGFSASRVRAQSIIDRVASLSTR